MMMKKHLLLLGTLIFLLSACGGQSADISADASGGQSQTAADVSAPAPEVTKPDASPTTDSSQTASSSQGAEDLREISQPEGAAVQPAPEPDPAAKPGQPVSVSASEPKDKPKPEPPARAQTPQAEEKPGGTAEPGASPEPDLKPEPPKASKETASAYIGRSVSSLISAIGEPKGRDYAPSCLGDGEDGELLYDGFTVYTYRTSGGEIVQDII